MCGFSVLKVLSCLCPSLPLQELSSRAWLSDQQRIEYAFLNFALFPICSHNLYLLSDTLKTICSAIPKKCVRLILAYTGNRESLFLLPFYHLLSRWIAPMCVLSLHSNFMIFVTHQATNFQGSYSKQSPVDFTSMITGKMGVTVVAEPAKPLPPYSPSTDYFSFWSTMPAATTTIAEGGDDSDASSSPVTSDTPTDHARSSSE